jgi:hypothetical protein
VANAFAKVTKQNSLVAGGNERRLGNAKREGWPKAIQAYLGFKKHQTIN